MKKVLAVLALLAAIGGFIWWRAHTPPKVGQDFARLAPAEKKQRRESARKLQTQIGTLMESARRKDRTPFTQEITETDLNTLLQDNIRSKNAPLRDLRAGITKEGLALQGQVSYKGFNAVVTMDGTVAATAGKLAYTLASLQIGGLPAPSSLRQKAEKQVASKINKYLGRIPGTIESVQAQDGKFVITGVTG